MFGIAALGLSAVASYGLYKYVRERQKAQQIKDAVDEMVWTLNSYDFCLQFYFSFDHVAFACSKLIFHAVNCFEIIALKLWVIKTDISVFLEVFHSCYQRSLQTCAVSKTNAKLSRIGIWKTTLLPIISIFTVQYLSLRDNIAEVLTFFRPTINFHE